MAQNRFFNELEEWLSEVTHPIDKAAGHAPGLEVLPMPQELMKSRTLANA